MRTVVALGLLVLSAGSLAAQQKLEWKWKESETFYVTTTRQVKQVLTIKPPRGDTASQAREVTQSYDILTRARFRVKSKDTSGTVVLEQVIELMDLKYPKGGQVPVPAVQGVTLTFHINAKNEVVKVEGHQALINRLADQKTARDFLNKAFSEDLLRQSLAEIFDFLPGEPVKTGAKWTRKSEYKLGDLGSLTLNRTFTLIGDEKRPEGTVSRIDLSADSVQTLEKDKHEVKATGQLYFEAERGRLAAANLTRTTRSALTLKFDDREHPTELNQTETITVQVTDRPPE